MSENSSKGTNLLHGGPPKTPLLVLEGDTGWIHTSVRRCVERLKFWNRVLKMDENRITCRTFDYDYKIYKGNWCYDMEQLFGNINNIKVYDVKMICKILNCNNIKIISGKENGKVTCKSNQN